MLDITAVDEISETFIEEQVKNYKHRLLQKQQNLIDARKKNLRKAHESKAAAENDLPIVLETIETKIAKAAAGKLRKISINFSGTDETKKIFLKMMLMQLLLLQGFLCDGNVRGYDLEISW